MADYLVKIGDAEVQCGSVEDAAQLLRALGVVQQQHPPAKVANGKVSSEPIARWGSFTKEALEVLKTLHKHGSSGVATDEVARIFGLSNSARMGGKTSKLRSLIDKTAGAEREKVYFVRMGRWYAGSSISKAIESLELLT